jgi:hypothetical protein
MVSLSALLFLAVLAGQTVGFAQFPSKEEARSSRTIVCACGYPGDGECDDGGPGSLHSVCGLGTDGGDCDHRGTKECGVAQCHLGEYHDTNGNCVAPCPEGEYKTADGYCVPPAPSTSAVMAACSCPEVQCPEVMSDGGCDGAQPAVTCRDAASLIPYFEANPDAPKCTAFVGDFKLIMLPSDRHEEMASSVYERLETISGDPNGAPGSCMNSGAGCPSGNVRVHRFDATQFSLDQLTSIAGSLDVTSNPQMKELSMKRLVDVGGDVVVKQNRILNTVSMDELTNVGGDLIVESPTGRGGSFLETFSMRKLASVTGKIDVKTTKGECGGTGKTATADDIACVKALFNGPVTCVAPGNAVTCRDAPTVSDNTDADPCTAFEGDFNLVMLGLADAERYSSSNFKSIKTISGDPNGTPDSCMNSGAGCPSGNVRLHRMDATQFSLDQLTCVEGSLDVTSNQFLQELSMKKLVDVGGDVVVKLNQYLNTVSMDELTNVRGDLIVQGVGRVKIETFSMKNLVSVTGTIDVKTTKGTCGGTGEAAIACVKALSD